MSSTPLEPFATHPISACCSEWTAPCIANVENYKGFSRLSGVRRIRSK
jgi:hypothetical protein